MEHVWTISIFTTGQSIFLLNSVVTSSQPVLRMGIISFELLTRYVFKNKHTQTHSSNFFVLLMILYLVFVNCHVGFFSLFLCCPPIHF